MSAVKEFDPKKNRARANGHWINYDRVVLATNNPVLGESSLIAGMLFQMKLSLYSLMSLARRFHATLGPIASFWDTNDPINISGLIAVVDGLRDLRRRRS